MNGKFSGELKKYYRGNIKFPIPENRFSQVAKPMNEKIWFLQSLLSPWEMKILKEYRLNNREKGNF